MAITTELTVSSQPTQLDKNVPVEITVTTNAATYDVVIADTAKVELKSKEENKFILNGKELGTSKIEVIATAAGGTEKRITWNAEVKVLPNSLEVNNPPTEIKIGEEKLLDIVSGAQNLEFKFEPTGIVRVDNNKTIVGIAVGVTKVTVIAKKEGADNIEKTFNITCVSSKETSTTGTGGVIKLYNNKSKRTTTLVTSDNESASDIIVELPSKSGTLITEGEYLKDLQYIQTPVIITPKNGDTDFKDLFVASEFESKQNIVHELSIWEFSKDDKFAKYETVKVSQNAEGNRKLNEFRSPYYGTFYVRLKYKSEEYQSQYSNVVKVSCAVPAIHNTKILKEAGGELYFGTVAHKDLVDDYNYRGIFNTIKENYDPNKYSQPTDTRPIYMKKGYQVIHDKKLYYAKVLMENKSKDAMIVPGSDDSKWGVDERNNLGTPRLVMEQLGIGFELNDGNANQITTEVNKIAGPINNELGYIQYTYKNKLCFTIPKPISNGIAFNDILQREGVHKNRTMRLGKNLYWIRLMYEDEYKMLFGRLMDGTYEKKQVADFELDKKTWIMDSREGAQRYVMYADANNQHTITKGDLDPKSRTGSYRFVLEYIPEELAPYQNLLSYFPAGIPKPADEKFIYDRYSDTGYFGVVTSDNFIGGNSFAAAVSFTSGTAQHDTIGWLKFYWHGMITFIAKKPIRYNVQWNHIKSHNCQYGWDTGAGDKKFLEIKGVNYRICNIMGARSAPYKHDVFTYGNSSKIEVNSTESNSFQYSHWGDLMCRIGNSYVGYTETANSQTWYPTYMDQIAGYQLGDHFTKFTHNDCGVFYQYEGNGTACYSRETGTGNYAISLGNCGFGEWNCRHALSHVSQHTSWRPLAVVDPQE